MSDFETTGSRLGRTASVTSTRTRASTVTSVTRANTGVVSEGVFRSRSAFAAVMSAVRTAARWLAETVTPAGWLVVGVLVVGLAMGIVAGWSLGWMLGVAAFAVLVFCVPFLLGGHDYRVHLELEHDRVVAGTDVQGRLEVRNAASRPALPGVVDVPVGDGLVEAHVPFLFADHTHVEQISIAARRRGVIDIGPLSVARADPIGILRREVVWPAVQTIHVHPATTPIPSTSAGLIRDLEGLPTSSIVDSDLAFHAIRQYLPGDSYRQVHWKSTAKTGKLMVRQYEETRQSRIAVLIGTDAVGEYASDDEFELAVGVAASLGAQAVRDGRELVVTTGAERPEVARGEVVAVRDIPTRSMRSMLDGFAEIEQGERVSRLEDVARLTAQANARLSVVFLVTGSQMPLDRLRAAVFAFGPDTAGVVVRCELDADPVMRQAGPLRVMTVGALSDLGQLIARGALQ
ncbi:DUF58 domain-containing protein [Microbacterium sp. P03]|uniref:DUF58 domain-containing protein n=1 Tax=Microbacterium sp. P03 TaxID=3366946 RepID=UPI0037451A41